MKKLSIVVGILIFSDIVLYNCANPGSPTGGPKDTIPPILLSSYPDNGSIEYKGEEILLSFSEFVTAEKLRNNLIVTPNTALKYKFIEKKNSVKIKLETILKDSTTYNFNFFNGITDITEKNPVINLTLAFSTGDYIDSLSVEGSIKDLLTHEPLKNFTVGLYKISDTLDFFTVKPTYFTTSNDSGRYHINYVKADNYRIIAFDDENSNLLLESDAETHAFLNDTILLDSAFQLRNMYGLLQDVKPIKLINHRNIGHYYEIKYSKQIDKYDFIDNDSLLSNIQGENKEVIRIYNPNQYSFGDSIQVFVNVQDSLKNQSIDTIKLIFSETQRDRTLFKSSGKIKVHENNKELIISSSKPIKNINSKLFKLKYDTLYSIIVNIDSITKNYSSDKWSVYFNYNADSIYNDIIRLFPKDTVYTDSINYTLEDPVLNQPTVKIQLEKGAFLSVEGDTSNLINESIPLFNNTDISKFGLLRLTTNSLFKKYTIQLLDKGNKVKYQQSENDMVVFKNILPGNYTIRVLIDNNQNGIWEYGNLHHGKEPEEVYIYPAEFSIRENFEIEESISF